MIITDESLGALQDRLARIHREDPAVLSLDIDLSEAEPGRIVMTMPVAEHMANGHGICHGGYLFTLADSALAYCCATAGNTAVSRSAEITFIAPAHVGQTITATATRRLTFGRNQICDVVLDAAGQTVAYFTGQGTVPSSAPTRTNA